MYKYIFNERLINYLMERGCYPIGEGQDYAIYEVTPYYREIIENYYILLTFGK